MAVALANPAGTKPEEMTFRLSPSQLGTFTDDPRMFWMHHRAGLRLPEGIKSSIPNDIDDLMKQRYDAHRVAGTLPPELAKLRERGIKLCPDMELLTRVRNWRKAPMFHDPETGCTMSGALDDIVIFPDGKMAPLDIKTTKLRDDFGAYATRYALIAQSWYGILLREVAGMGVHNASFLPYYYPKIDPRNTSQTAFLEWGCELVEMKLDRESALRVFRDAVRCLRGPMPPAAVASKGQRIHDYNGWALEYAAVVAQESRAALAGRKPGAAIVDEPAALPAASGGGIEGL